MITILIRTKRRSRKVMNKNNSNNRKLHSNSKDKVNNHKTIGSKQINRISRMMIVMRMMKKTVMKRKIQIAMKMMNKKKLNKKKIMIVN
jgi:hypothetical protein